MALHTTYELEQALYINLTNACTNQCAFCVRNNPDGVKKGLDLWLDRDPTAQEVVDEIFQRDLSAYSELVFCGYGEPLMRADVLFAVSRKVKEAHPMRIRINTNGQANLFHKRDITPEMKGIIDVVPISLNAATREAYQAVCASQFGEESFDAMLDFAIKCKEVVPTVVLTVVDVMETDEIERCRKISDDLGVGFRVRAMIS